MYRPALGFMVFILVLGIVVPISLNTIMPLTKKTKEMYYTETYDKTVKKLEGDIADTDYDGAMSIEEVILTVMGQTYFLPKPGYLDVCGTRIDIVDNISFSTNSDSVAMQANTAITNWYSKFNAPTGYTKPPRNKARFRFEFSMNEASNKDDDSYSLYIELDRDDGTGKRMFRCDANGAVTRKGGIY